VSHETVAPTRDWNALLASSGNPLSPTLGELTTAALTREEARRLETHLRPLVEAGEGVMRLAVAYLRASYWDDDPPLLVQPPEPDVRTATLKRLRADACGLQS
jgi:hypothetical protein